jgi:hypothetical protein
METFETIKSVRLAINDPMDFIDILEVDELPASPAPQTAYKLTTTGAYMATDKTSEATASDYHTVDLFLSDQQISTVIESIGATAAVCRCFSLIARKLGSKFPLVKTTSGTESAEYQRLSELYAYYKGLADDCKEQNKSDAGNSTGRWGQTAQPTIAEDNL